MMSMTQLRSEGVARRNGLPMIAALSQIRRLRKPVSSFGDFGKSDGVSGHHSAIGCTFASPFFGLRSDSLVYSGSLQMNGLPQALPLLGSYSV
jgi:hypothetical protein